VAVFSAMAPAALAQLEEIVVTARKRSENLQDVPMAISAFTSESIERKGITDLGDVAKYTSGVMLDEGFNKQDTRVVIRGLSPTRGRQNVAILQDDVDISSLAQATAGGSFVINPRLLDVERIEVIKGPHSALYGRSAFNGAINYISRKPGNEFRANVQGSVADFDTQDVRASLSGPVIADKLSLGFNVATWNAGGMYKSPTTGKGLSGGDGWGAALALKATPFERLTITARSEYSDDTFTPEAGTIKNPTNAPLPAIVFQTINGLAPVLGAAVAANPANATFPQTYGSLGHASDFPIASPSRNPRTGQDYPGSTRQIFRNTLRGEWAFEPMTLTSITHIGRNKTFQFNDAASVGDLADPSVSGAQETYFDTKTNLFSQELRLQSTTKGRLNWMVGGLYWNEDLTQLNKALRCVSSSGGCYAAIAAAGSVVRTLTGNPAVPADDITYRDTYHTSAYGQLEFAITDALKAGVELRYTKETEKTYAYAVISPTTIGCANVTVVGRSTAANGAISCVSAAAQVTGPFTASGATAAVVKSSFTTPRFTLDYKLNPDVLTYVSAAQGKKPGGLSPLTGIANVAANTYLPEEMWAYELGAKTSWLDRRLQLNGAIYYQDYSKKQVSITFVDPNSLPTPNQLAQRVVNAASAAVKGFEIELNAAPTDFLSLNASYTYNDAKYKKFTDIQSGAAAISRAVINNPNACTVVQVLVGAALQNRCSLDYSGNRLEGAPKHSLVVGGELRGNLANERKWFVDTDVRYQSDRFTSFENSLVMDAYWLADLRAGVRSQKWSLTAFVNNLFNDDTMKASAVYIQNFSIAYLTATGRTPLASQSPSGARALLPDKRQVGIRFSYDF
jgi:outer membrane receptor protein involved in Fe transport